MLLLFKHNVVVVVQAQCCCCCCSSTMLLLLFKHNVVVVVQGQCCCCCSSTMLLLLFKHNAVVVVQAQCCCCCSSTMLLLLLKHKKWVGLVDGWVWLTSVPWGWCRWPSWRAGQTPAAGDPRRPPTPGGCSTSWSWASGLTRRLWFVWNSTTVILSGTSVHNCPDQIS